MRASKFGKKFIEKNKNVLKRKKINLGSKKLLKGKKLNNMRVGGIVSIRKYPKDKLRNG